LGDDVDLACRQPERNFRKAGRDLFDGLQVGYVLKIARVMPPEVLVTLSQGIRDDGHHVEVPEGLADSDKATLQGTADYGKKIATPKGVTARANGVLLRMEDCARDACLGGQRVGVAGHFRGGAEAADSEPRAGIETFGGFLHKGVSFLEKRIRP
jgi:hypothetical protein